VLRAANSAIYGLARQIRSIDEAIFRIGFREVWTIAAALKAKDLFRASRAEWNAMAGLLWEHALKTAMVARAIGRHAHVQGTEELFTAGVLHDLGKLILSQAAPGYALLANNGALRGRELTLREMDFFGTSHAIVGAELLRRWDLPDSLSSIVERHHEDIFVEDPLRRQRAILALANEMAHACDAFGPGEDMTKRQPPLPPEVLAIVGMDLATSWQVAAQSQKQLALLRTIQG
jgi:putative nucleotidyltransferase with HDIG domain